METTLAANADLIEGIFFGFMFAIFYFAPSIIRKLPFNHTATGVYFNENGSACSRGRF